MVEATTTAKISDEDFLRMTADVVAAYVSNNALPTQQLAEIIGAVYSSLRSLDGHADAKHEPLKPAVPIRKSITPEYLICLEDGKKLKMLKRHLRSTYSMTPDDYRIKWSLSADSRWSRQIMQHNGRPSRRRLASDAATVARPASARPRRSSRG